MGISKLVFFVNGRKITVDNADPSITLLQFLRNKLRLTGTKLGCAEGGCGACTVMVSRYDRKEKKIRHYAVNACLAPLCSLHGLAVTTTEGIGSTKTGIHPVQERIAKFHGSQCGFCTPGIVMSMYALLRNNPQPTTELIEEAFQGNLCRCTGYRPILAGFKTFSKEFACGLGDECCRNKKQVASKMLEKVSTNTVDISELISFDPTQEPIFPSELQLTEQYDKDSLHFKGEKVQWFRPSSLDELLTLKKDHPQAKLVVGNTEVGVEVKFKNMEYPVIIAPSHIAELLVVEHTDTGIRFGASTTLAKMEEILNEAIETLPEHQTRVFAAIVEMLRWFAGHQIRNVAAVAGNIMTASPISDLNPIFLSAGCKLLVSSKDGGEREIVMNEKFFTGYRKTVVRVEEVLVSVTIPYTRQNEYFFAYKQASRKEDDISIVNAGMRVLFKPESIEIEDIALSFGGMAPVTVMATKCMKQVIGRKWEDSLVTDVCKLLAEELSLPAGTPGGMESYRCTLTTSFFFKFYLTVLLELQKNNTHISGCIVPESYRSVTADIKREASKGVQVYEEVSENQPKLNALGRPLQHMSAVKQATGEAVYCDDMPHYENELYLAFVKSTKAHARLVSVDFSAAEQMTGVYGVATHKDVPGSNITGTLMQDEEIFASDKVTCQGQAIAVVVADTQEHAQQAARAVKIQYEELPSIITIEQAIEAQSFIPPTRTITVGDVKSGFSKSDHVIEGEIRVGGQEHFYLETHANITVPTGEDGEMKIYTSAQAPTAAQMSVAQALGISANKIEAHVKRMGGGFGGKESRFSVLLLPTAVAAHKFNRPVRCMLDRNEDMVMTGTRHPFLGRYKVGFSKEGHIIALEIDMYANCGNSMDLSKSVMERALFHLDNCYRIPNLRATGYLCKTNLSSNTAFRGFGGPQGLFICENWITDIAITLGISQEKVREVNMYHEGEATHFSQKMNLCNIKQCWDEVIKQSNMAERQQKVKLFNRENRWKKRGIAIIPTKFGISFTTTFLNQAGALIHVYTDGSVLLTHAGTEMGQGLHTKMIQIASKVLNIPVTKIHISETSTNTVPNTSPTAASVGSDINGMAVMNACQIIMKRLQPYIAKNPGGCWEDWVKTAYFDRVSLSSTGFYRTPDLNYDWEKNEGNPFNYFTYGTAVSEVEIDCLTGDHVVLRTDIVMDIGKSLNPAIDIGQIEGAFIQGYGLFTLEYQKYSPDGFLFTQGPGNYKIPGFGDIPVEFNVSLLKGSSNPRAVYSSKGIGEPPLFMGASVFFAIKDAIMAARTDAGLQGPFRLDSPATSGRIRMACQDQFTKQFPESEPGTYRPWYVHI